MSAESSVALREPDVAGGLPLWEAAQRYCDRSLVDAFQAAFDSYRSFLFGGSELRPFTMQVPGTLAFAGLLIGRESFIDAFRRQRDALTKLEADLRSRLARRSLMIWGVQETPKLQRHRTHLSPDWAGAMQFEWRENAVKFGQFRFVGVACMPAAAGAAIVDASEGTIRRGRPPFQLERFVAIARTHERHPNRKRDATELLALYCALYEDHRPAHLTLMRHLDEIYRALDRQRERPKRRK